MALDVVQTSLSPVGPRPCRLSNFIEVDTAVPDHTRVTLTLKTCNILCRHADDPRTYELCGPRAVAASDRADQVTDSVKESSDLTELAFSRVKYLPRDSSITCDDAYTTSSLQFTVMDLLILLAISKTYSHIR